MPPRYRKSVEQAITLFRFLEKKESATFGAVFQPLLGPLDDAATALISDTLSAHVPADPQAQKIFFEPLYDSLKKGDVKYHIDNAKRLRRLLVHKTPLMPVGQLNFCLRYSTQTHEVGGVFQAIRDGFASLGQTNFAAQVESIYEFRNKHVAHVDVELQDRALAETGLKHWVDGLVAIHALRTNGGKGS